MYAHEMIFDTFGIQQLAKALLLMGLQLELKEKLRSRSARLFLLWSGTTWTEFVGCLAFFCAFFFYFFNDRNKM